MEEKTESKNGDFDHFGGFDSVQRWDVVAILKNTEDRSAGWQFGFVREKCANGLYLVLLDESTGCLDGVDGAGATFFTRLLFNRFDGRTILRSAFTAAAWERERANGQRIRRAV
jgi:hypothetical protein